jgi:hypothetical protein
LSGKLKKIQYVSFVSILFQAFFKYLKTPNWG